MNATDNALSLSLLGTPDLGNEVLKALYRITGRSTVELRRSIRAGEPVYTAALFGSDHIDVVPRLEKVAAHLDAISLPFVVHEWADGVREEISPEVMREILDAATDDAD